MIKEAIAKIVDKQDLTFDEAYKVISEIMAGETTPTQNLSVCTFHKKHQGRDYRRDNRLCCSYA